MQDQWERTDLIQMSVQTADLRFEPLQERPLLFLSCGLVNIARGSCQLTICAADSNQPAQGGALLINADRPVMTGTIQVIEQQFERMIQTLSVTPVRPVTLAVQLSQHLPVSLEGFLFIDEDQTVEILSLQVNMPLR
tara:strand:- start:307 stop:717 length:411 start_codon:yes stop_codon:yes gene_type:complete